MQTSFSGKSIYVGSTVFSLATLIHTISDIGIRQQSYTHGSPFGKTELHRNVVKTGVLGILFNGSITEVGILHRDTSVKHKSQRINRRIRCRIRKVGLIPVT